MLYPSLRSRSRSIKAKRDNYAPSLCCHGRLDSLLSLAASFASSSVAGQAIITLTTSQISAYRPYASYASAAYCSASTTKNSSCGGVFTLLLNCCAKDIFDCTSSTSIVVKNGNILLLNPSHRPQRKRLIPARNLILILLSIPTRTLFHLPLPTQPPLLHISLPRCFYFCIHTTQATLNTQPPSPPLHALKHLFRP